MGFDLSGRTALVTGASSGLGARFALALAEAGADVAIGARRSDRLKSLAREIENKGRRALALDLDVTDLGSIEKAVASTETELGSIGILVNNAGVARPKWIADNTLDDYNYIMDTNVKGAWLMAQTVGRRMIAQKNGGAIVNVASMAAYRPLHQLALYAMSKAAVVMMTKSMAFEWGRFGIRVNGMAPGYIETEMNSDYFKTDAGKAAIQRMPRKRIGQPKDLDGTLLLLASDASDFINGTIVMIDDGQSL